jgi:hypothetical protein
MYDCNVDKLDAASTRARRCNCRCSRRPGRIGAVTLPIIARVDSCETLEIRAIRAARRHRKHGGKRGKRARLSAYHLRPTPLALIAQALHASTSTSTIPIAIAVAEYIRCHMRLGTRTPWLEYRCVFACARHRVYAPTLSASGVYSCVVASRDLRACRPRIIIVGHCLRAKKRRWRSVTLALASHRALHSVQRLSTLFEAWLRRVAVERG